MPVGPDQGPSGQCPPIQNFQKRWFCPIFPSTLRFQDLHPLPPPPTEVSGALPEYGIAGDSGLGPFLHRIYNHGVIDLALPGNLNRIRSELSWLWHALL